MQKLALLAIVGRQSHLQCEFWLNMRRGSIFMEYVSNYQRTEKLKRLDDFCSAAFEMNMVYRGGPVSKRKIFATSSIFKSCGAKRIELKFIAGKV